jgi:hypothetical protein
MTTERAKTVRGLLDEHRRRRAAVGNRARNGLPLRAQVPSLNPIKKWYKDQGHDINRVRRGAEASRMDRGGA